MAIFTKDDLAAYLQVDDIDDATALLLLELVTTEITTIVGESRFSSTPEQRFKPVALDMAKRMYNNPSGLRSHQESLDDWSETDTYAAETVQPFEVTLSEHRRIRKAAGMRGAFSIEILDPS